jgi:hypothetical protein
VFALESYVSSNKEHLVSNLWADFERNTGKFCRFVPIANFDYSVNISLKYNYLYAETPKAGCSTIKSVLQKMELDDPEFYRQDFVDIHNRNFSPLLKPSQVGNFDNFIISHNPFKFCFSRNPYSRLLSAYLDKIDMNEPQKRNVLLHLGKDVSQLNQNISFEEFIKVVSEQPIPSMDPHWRIQYYQTYQDVVEYDFIGKIESFTEDFNFVLSKISVDYDKFLSNERRHTKDADGLLLDFYTSELANIVQEKFAIDFDYFGYPLDLATNY